MAEVLTEDEVRALLPCRRADAHKGVFGHVLVIAGSRGFTGAARLAAEGALRAGAGLVTLAIPRPLADVAAVGLVEAMTAPLPATEEESFAASALEPALDLARGKDAVVLGPGLSRHPETVRFVGAFTRRCPLPMVVDADGLNALSEQPEALREAEGLRILTPHPGEMARLSGVQTVDVQRNREASAVHFARKHGCIVILKGAGTVIAPSDGGYRVNPTGNPGMATGGTGDVLAGLLGGLLAQGFEPVKACWVGVFAHGMAGDMAAARMSQRGMLARDVLEDIPRVWLRWEKGGSSLADDTGTR